MNTYPVIDAGYSSYYDEADEIGGLAMGRIGAIVTMTGLGGPSVPVEAAPPPTPGFPVSGQPGQISTPAQIALDAANLRELGYAAPTTGNAFDPKFRAAVSEFQRDVSPSAGPVDGLIGPNTRTIIASELAARRAAGQPFGPPAPPAPPFVLPPSVIPQPVPPQLPAPATPAPSSPLQPAKTKEDDDAMLYVGVGVGVLALFGLAYYATR